MHRLVLASEEKQSIKELTQELATTYHRSEEPEFIDLAAVYAHELPKRVRLFLHNFKSEKLSAVGIISGFPINDRQIGKTPSHWKWKNDEQRTLQEQILFVLFGALLGEVLAWSTQQNSRIIHDILPIKGHERKQLGSGSTDLLSWHTEDAFHPYRSDYIGLLCLRNPDAIATTIAEIDDIELDSSLTEILFQPDYTIRPDESHLEKHASDIWQQEELENNSALQRAYDRINKMNASPEKRGVLSGDPNSPYLCMDPYFMDPVGERRAQKAFEEIVTLLNENIKDVVLKPGDYCFIDNFRAVHGRRAFKAKYDGNDRWLKRINITRNLRRSRDMRMRSTSRVIL